MTDWDVVASLSSHPVNARMSDGVDAPVRDSRRHPDHVLLRSHRGGELRLVIAPMVPCPGGLQFWPSHCAFEELGRVSNHAGLYSNVLLARDETDALLAAAIGGSWAAS
jgi:hypothetical protein